MTLPVAGWYPDPGGSGGRRYWNGQAWTEHVAAPATPVVASPPPVETPGPPLIEPVEAPPEPVAPEPPPAGYPPVPEPGYQPTQVMLPPPTPQPGPMDQQLTTAFPQAPPPPPTGWAGPGMQPVAVAPSTTLGPDGQVLSGWWRRLLGYLIDSLLIGLVAAGILGLVAAFTGGFGEIFNTQAWNNLLAEVERNPDYQPTQSELEALVGPGLWTGLAWLTGLTLVLSFGNGVLLVMRSGQTIGDRVVGTRKIMPGRRVPGFGPAFVRWIIPGLLNLLQALPLIAFLAFAAWLLDYLWPLWDPRNQALHDKAAGTYVERSALAGPPNP